MIRGLSVGLLGLALACDSSGPAPIEPLAVEYCEECCDYCDENDPAFEQQTTTCERVTNEALTVVCQNETEAYYACVTRNVVDPPDTNKLKCDTAACETEWAARNLCLGTAPRDEVRVRIFSVRVFNDRCSANIGYRGTGPTREGHTLPENSISSFLAAMDEGADGVQLDAAITADGEIVVMHDDTLDRTTGSSDPDDPDIDCAGCVSLMTLDEIRACRLLDGAGNTTEERPPTLLEVYSAIGGNALINVELNVFEPPCLTPTTGVEQLVPAVLEEVTRIAGENRTIFSSLDATAAALVKTERPGYYSAIVSDDTEDAVARKQDAIHPDASVPKDTVTSALDEGLQVNVLVVDTALTDEQIVKLMEEQIEKGSTAIISNEPAILADVLTARPPPCPP
jgi:glycerophosphoryl diester phosphodiesterase